MMCAERTEEALITSAWQHGFAGTTGMPSHSGGTFRENGTFSSVCACTRAPPYLFSQDRVKFWHWSCHQHESGLNQMYQLNLFFRRGFSFRPQYYLHTYCFAAYFLILHFPPFFFFLPFCLASTKSSWFVVFSLVEGIIECSQQNKGISFDSAVVRFRTQRNSLTLWTAKQGINQKGRKLFILHRKILSCQNFHFSSN